MGRDAAERGVPRPRLVAIDGLLAAAVESGRGGFKVHEDWGATPAQIDTCLTVAEAPACRWPCTPTR